MTGMTLDVTNAILMVTVKQTIMILDLYPEEPSDRAVKALEVSITVSPFYRFTLGKRALKHHHTYKLLC